MRSNVNEARPAAAEADANVTGALAEGHDVAAGERFASGEHRIRYGTVRQPVTEVVEKKLAQMRDLPRVIKGTNLAAHAGDRFANVVITAQDNSPLTTLVAFLEVIPAGGRSNKHCHQNDALFYILSGVGYDIHDGDRFDWQAGDVAIVPPGCTHQHFNASDTEPVVALVLNPKLIYLAANLVYQKVFERPFNPKYPDEQGHAAPAGAPGGGAANGAVGGGA